MVLHRMKEDTCRTIELAWQNDAGFTSDPAHVANIFADQYRELGRDTPPDGHTFDMDARRCQDIRVAELLKLPVHRGPVGHDVTTFELFRAIGKMQYGKASGGDLISTDLLKMLAKELGDDDSNPVFDRKLFNTRCSSANATVGFGTTSSPESAGRILCLG